MPFHSPALLFHSPRFRAFVLLKGHQLHHAPIFESGASDARLRPWGAVADQKAASDRGCSPSTATWRTTSRP